LVILPASHPRLNWLDMKASALGSGIRVTHIEPVVSPNKDVVNCEHNWLPMPGWLSAVPITGNPYLNVSQHALADIRLSSRSRVKCWLLSGIFLANENLTVMPIRKLSLALSLTGLRSIILLARKIFIDWISFASAFNSLAYLSESPLLRQMAALTICILLLDTSINS